MEDLQTAPNRIVQTARGKAAAGTVNRSGRNIALTATIPKLQSVLGCQQSVTAQKTENLNQHLCENVSNSTCNWLSGICVF